MATLFMIAVSPNPHPYNGPATEALLLANFKESEVEFTFF